MKDLDIILTRESVREYKDEPIKEEDLNTILKCAMSGPSCKNLRDYAFIVLTKKDKINELANLIGPTCRPLLNAPCAIIVLQDISRAHPKDPDYRIIDATIAAQNIMLSANALDIGTCMLGIYPMKERIQKVKEFFNLPDNVDTNSIISMGYKLEKTNGKDHFEEDRIHYNKW